MSVTVPVPVARILCTIRCRCCRIHTLAILYLDTQIQILPLK